MIDVDILRRLTETIESRKGADPGSSYVASLFSKGHDAILKKIGEEAAETLLAAKDGDKLPIRSRNRRSLVSLSGHAGVARPRSG